jgi:hypothetical protein
MGRGRLRVNGHPSAVLVEAVIWDLDPPAAETVALVAEEPAGAQAVNDPGGDSKSGRRFFDG